MVSLPKLLQMPIGDSLRRSQKNQEVHPRHGRPLMPQVSVHDSTIEKRLDNKDIFEREFWAEKQMEILISRTESTSLNNKK